MFISRRGWAALGAGVLLAVSPTAAGAAVRMDQPPSPPAPSAPSVGQLPGAGDLQSINPNDDGKDSPGSGKDSDGDDSDSPSSQSQGPAQPQGPLPSIGGGNNGGDNGGGNAGGLGGIGGGGNHLPGTGIIPQQGQPSGPDSDHPSHEKGSHGDDGSDQSGQSSSKPDDAPQAASHQNAPQTGETDPNTPAPAGEAAPDNHRGPVADNPDSNSGEHSDSAGTKSHAPAATPQGHRQGPVRTGSHGTRHSSSSAHQRTHRSEEGSEHRGPWWSDGQMNGGDPSDYGDGDDDGDGGGGAD